MSLQFTRYCRVDVTLLEAKYDMHRKYWKKRKQITDLNKKMYSS
jgi:hypothetical protein